MFPRAYQIVNFRPGTFHLSTQVSPPAWSPRLRSLRRLQQIKCEVGQGHRSGAPARPRADTFRTFCVYSNRKLTRQRVDRKADLVVGVEQDTTMRGRPLAGSKRRRSDSHPLVMSSRGPASPRVVRLFRPDEINLDDLAEAIRYLLGDGTAAQIVSPSAPNTHLLFFPDRGTDVVEATRRP